jgi:hypothetical protein
MEVPQGNSLCSYLQQAKMSFFFLLFILYKIGEQEGGKVPPGGVVLVGGGEGRERRVGG